jgi:hypothetical protein
MEIDYNKIYSKQELDELKAWFDAQELPQSMQIDASTFAPNLKKTVETLWGQAMRFHDNPNMYGALYLLERIRAHLLESENKKEE